MVTRDFRPAQLVSAAYMGHSHGLNDAQKTMGIIALALVAATKRANSMGLPAWLSFLRLPISGRKTTTSPSGSR